MFFEETNIFVLMIDVVFLNTLIACIIPTHFLCVCVVLLQKYCCSICAGPRVDNFQALDPRKQELLEARFLGMRSTSNPAGGSGATLQHQQLQQHAATMAGSHSAGPPPGCHVMTTAATNQLVQQSLQQPSPSSLLNANAPPPPSA